MNTKIVYAITSTLEDIFWEQLWASAWSLKYHNPTAYCIVVTDKETYEAAKNSHRKASFDLFDEIIPVEFESSYTKKRRSRWIKIKTRELIRGDILYVDSDTVVTGELSELDTFDFNIGMVYDLHSNPRPTLPTLKYREIYGQEMETNVPYYNGGLFYAKDNVTTKMFFAKWFDNWTYAKEKVEYNDQVPLVRTVIELKNPVTVISGIYNCQPLMGIRYLQEAKIVHFYNNPYLFASNVHPLLNAQTYYEIKEKGFVTEDFKHLLINCKSEFSPISSLVDINIVLFMKSHSVRVLYNLYRRKRGLFNLINKVMRIIGKTFICLNIAKEQK